MQRSPLVLGFVTSLVVLSALLVGCHQSAPVEPIEKAASELGSIASVTHDFSACKDAQIRHNDSNCGSCAPIDFTVNSVSASAYVSRSGSQNDLCGEQQAFISFDTSSLNGQCANTAATFKFWVAALSGFNVTTARIRVYSKTTSGSCPSGPLVSDFIGCASGYTDHGTITITSTGQKTLAVGSPDTNISKDGRTKFMLVDDSIFTDESGTQSFEIYMTESANPQWRPSLSVVAENCFATCLDGQVNHSHDVACSYCFSSFLTYDTTAPHAQVYVESDIACEPYKVAAFYFDTSGLNDTNTIMSAIFGFTVRDFAAVNLLTHRLRLYSRKVSGSCPSAFGYTDWILCATYTDLGTITITGAGTHSFSVPNPDANINKTGATEFVAVDASTFTEPSYSVLTNIYTIEGGTLDKKPKLVVNN